MKTTKFTEKVGKIWNKFAFVCKKRSPEIWLVIGITTGGAAMVTAGVAAYKSRPAIDNCKESLSEIQQKHNDEHQEDTETLTTDEKAESRAIVKGTVVIVAKQFVVPVTLGTMSALSILTSHKLIRARNASIAAAYGMLNTAFTNYRANVVDELGEDADKQFRFGLKNEEVTIVDPETGERVKDVTVPVQTSASDYSCAFDSKCKAWVPTYEYNKYALQMSQAYMNNLLKARGYVFLSDVIDPLGLPISKKIGNVVGWYYDPNDKTRDNYIDYRITDTYIKNEDGDYEPVIMLDFNVDGPILDLMK